MDGTNRAVVVSGTDKVHWPNGLAIDFRLDRLYFTDAYLDHIAYCNLTGAGFHILISRHPLVQHPYAISVFKASSRNALFLLICLPISYLTFRLEYLHAKC